MQTISENAKFSYLIVNQCKIYVSFFDDFVFV